MAIPGGVTGSSLNYGDVFLEDLYWNPAATSASTVYTTTFDPTIKLGWRGPYLTNSGGNFNLTSLADGSFALYTRRPSTLTPQIVDAWDNPIILQWPSTGSASDAMYIRLVSAGPPSKTTGAGAISSIDTPANVQMPLPSQRGNDIVLFLRVADPYASLPGAPQ